MSLDNSSKTKQKRKTKTGKDNQLANLINEESWRMLSRFFFSSIFCKVNRIIRKIYIDFAFKKLTSAPTHPNFQPLI